MTGIQVIPPDNSYQEQLAQQLMGQGSQTGPVYSQMQGLAKLADALAGKHLSNEYQQNQQDRQKTMTHNLQTMVASATGPDGKLDPMALGKALMGDPNTAGMGLQMLTEAAKQQQKPTNPGFHILDPKIPDDAAILKRLPPGSYQRDMNPNSPSYLKVEPAGSASAAQATNMPYDPQTADAAATVVMSDPNRIRDYASFGATGQAARTQIQQAITKKLQDAGMTPADLVALRARAHAEQGNLSTLTKQQAQLGAADQLVHANGDRLMQLFDLVDNTGVPMIEGFTRSAKRQAGGVDPAELTSVLTTFQTEVARMLNGNPNMTGVISDSLRDEISKMAPGNMSTAQAKRIINRLYLETSIRKQAVDDQLNSGVLQSVVGGTPTAGITPQAQPQQTAQNTAPPAAIAALKANNTPQMQAFFKQKYGYLPP